MKLLVIILSLLFAILGISHTRNVIRDWKNNDPSMRVTEAVSVVWFALGLFIFGFVFSVVP